MKADQKPRSVRHGRARGPSFFVVAVFAAACADWRSATRADCSRESTDSARAVCLALDTLARAWGLESRVRGIARDGGTIRVYTMPADPTTLDGTGVIDVGPEGRIVRAIVTDSA